MTWEELLIATGFNLSAQSIQINNDKARRGISFYKNGTVYVADCRGAVIPFKKCPYDLMFQMFLQFYKENQNDD